MVDFWNAWNGQRSLFIAYLEQDHAYLSGKVYYSAWRTDISFPHVFAMIVEDNPEVEQWGQADANYKVNTRWRFTFRQLSTGVPDTDVMTLVSGVGAICNTASKNQTGANWDYVVIDNVNFHYISPDIDAGVIQEGTVDLVFRKGGVEG